MLCSLTHCDEASAPVSKLKSFSGCRKEFWVNLLCKRAEARPKKGAVISAVRDAWLALFELCIVTHFSD